LLLLFKDVQGKLTFRERNLQEERHEARKFRFIPCCSGTDPFLVAGPVPPSNTCNVLHKIREIRGGQRAYGRTEAAVQSVSTDDLR
jgi:hypothetical protein